MIPVRMKPDPDLSGNNKQIPIFFAGQDCESSDREMAA
ncbi:Uncharacterized protein dnm_060280 [Desulfonema magnum]|uniref:Uncharacterized protein n=1 Tax=Desulfonema magnum TaxID=45655 RepID=A0A975GQJ8_9BACT|nr:Uncharacterized protein dnm_060280 [Desulfonema magnum]